MRRWVAVASLALALAAALPTRAVADDPVLETIVEVVQVVRSFRCTVVSPYPMFVWVCWFS